MRSRLAEARSCVRYRTLLANQDITQMKTKRITELVKPMAKKVMALVGKPILEPVLQIESWIARLWVSSAHQRLMSLQWTIPPQPEHFDHQIDLFYQWLESRNSLWVERGVFSSLALSGGNVLELACGDGFNARNFYSLRSKHLIACDFDQKAIEIARRKNCAPNVTFVLADIRTAMPAGTFQNVIWDAAIEHFTPDEILQILKDIKCRLHKWRRSERIHNC